jgi:hypothetical protein
MFMADVRNETEAGARRAPMSSARSEQSGKHRKANRSLAGSRSAASGFIAILSRQ